MKVTTTKKLKGVLEIPSIGLSMQYDHQNNKAQVRTLHDKHASNSELLAARDLCLITLTEMPKMDLDDEFASTNETVRIINKTGNPIILPGKNPRTPVTIFPHGSANVPKEMEGHPAITQLVEKGKIEVEKASVQSLPEPRTDFDEPEEPQPEKKPTKKSDTSPVVVNPNKEATYKTKNSIETQFVTPLFDPPDVISEDNSDEVVFVDKVEEQRKAETVKSLKSAKRKAPKGTTETETVQSEDLSGTTPVVVQRKKSPAKPKKTSASARAKKIPSADSPVFDIGE